MLFKLNLNYIELVLDLDVDGRDGSEGHRVQLNQG